MVPFQNAESPVSSPVGIGGNPDAVQEREKGSGVGHFPTECGAHEFAAGDHADAAEVEPVGIPTGADRRIRRMMAFGVPDAGMDQRVEGGVVEIEEFSPQAGGIRRTAAAMVGIVAFVFPLRVMEPREQAGHQGIRAGLAGQPEAVLLDAFPMCWPVVGRRAEMELAADGRGHLVEITPAVRRHGEVVIS